MRFADDVPQPSDQPRRLLGASTRIFEQPPQNPKVVTDFSSDVGRIKFGFSHEDIDDSTAYYEGQFKLYQRCGEGTLHSPETGSKYVGQFKADNFHGVGDQTWSDGSRYIGQWKNGQKNGSGIYIGVDKLQYDGQWADGRRHGHGSQEYCNGDKYKGLWAHGLFSGSGVYHFADGSRYEGAWSNGRYDGQGMFYCFDGQRERHCYSSGLLMKREVLPPGAPPKNATRAQLAARRKTIFGQTREDMHKPTVLPRLQPSKYLIHRETAGIDLSAPMLRPKTASAQVGMADSLIGVEDLVRPSTAGGESVLPAMSPFERSDLASTTTPGDLAQEGMLRGGTSGTCNRKELESLDSFDHELDKRGGHYSA